MKEIRKKYRLDRPAVDETSEEIVAWLGKHRVDNENVERIRLTAEEMMLTMLNHFGADTDKETELILCKKHGNLIVRITCSGESFDPTVIYDRDSRIGSVLEYMGIIPVWRYSRGINSLSFTLTANPIRSEVVVLGAVILSVVLGIIGGVIPESISAGIIKYVLDPISDTFMGLLKVFSGMLIFLSIVVGICGIGGGSEFGKFGKFVIGRYIGTTFLFGSVVIAALIPFFHFTWGETISFSSAFDELFELTLGIIPDNLFKPFIENNMLQILLLAVIFGVVILGAGDKSYKLRSLISDIQMLFMKATGMICKALPFFVFCSLLSLFWKNGMETFLYLWQPVVGCIVVSFTFIAVQCVYVSVKLKVSPVLLFKKILPAYLVGLTSASSMAAFGKSAEICRKRLGLSARYSDFALPMGIPVYKNLSILTYVPMTLYLVQEYNVGVSVLWFVFTWILLALMTYATPSVSGGALICVGIILQQFGIPSEAIAIGSTVALLSNFFSSGAKVASLHFEMILQAYKLKMIDVETLRSKKNLTD